MIASLTDYLHCILPEGFPAFKVNKYPPLAASIGYPPPDRSRLYKGGYIHCFYYHIVICQFDALFPLVTSQAWLRSDVLEPHPGVNCWREP